MCVHTNGSSSGWTLIIGKEIDNGVEHDVLYTRTFMQESNVSVCATRAYPRLITSSDFGVMNINTTDKLFILDDNMAGSPPNTVSKVMQ